MRDEHEIANTRDPKPPKDKQVFVRICTSFEGNIGQPMRLKMIGKRARESFNSKANAKAAEFIRKLKDRVDNLKFVLGLIYKMLKAKELRVIEAEIKVPTRP